MTPGAVGFNGNPIVSPRAFGRRGGYDPSVAIGGPGGDFVGPSRVIEPRSGLGVPPTPYAPGSTVILPGSGLAGRPGGIARVPGRAPIGVGPIYGGRPFVPRYPNGGYRYGYPTFGFCGSYRPFGYTNYAPYPVPVPVYEPYPVPVPTPDYGAYGPPPTGSAMVEPPIDPNAFPPPEGGQFAPDAAPGPESGAPPQPMGRPDVVGKQKPQMPVVQMQKLMGQGVEQFVQQDYDGAARQFLQVAMADQNNVDAWLAYAVARFATGEFGMAAMAIRRGVKQFPEVVNSDFDIRERYGDNKDFDQHLKALEDYVIDKPQDADGWLTLGFVRHFSSQRDLAQRAFHVVQQRYARDADLAKTFLEAKPPAPAPREGQTPTIDPSHAPPSGPSSAGPGDPQMESAIDQEQGLRDADLVQPSGG